VVSPANLTRAAFSTFGRFESKFSFGFGVFVKGFFVAFPKLLPALFVAFRRAED